MQNICRLLPLVREDHSHLVSLFTDPDARAFLGGPVDVDAASIKATAWIDSSPGTPVWAIRRMADSTFLGYVLLSPHHDKTDTEISYALLPDHWGKGYASEALSHALDHAFGVLNLGRVIAETQLRNLRSKRLLERVGMQEERRLHRFGEIQIIYGVDCERWHRMGNSPSARIASTEQAVAPNRSFAPSLNSTSSVRGSEH
jgi:ribosomal-protein-alanine N-acetyltransferase